MATAADAATIPDAAPVAVELYDVPEPGDGDSRVMGPVSVFRPVVDDSGGPAATTVTFRLSAVPPAGDGWGFYVWLEDDPGTYQSRTWAYEWDTTYAPATPPPAEVTVTIPWVVGEPPYRVVSAGYVRQHGAALTFSWAGPPNESAFAQAGLTTDRPTWEGTHWGVTPADAGRDPGDAATIPYGPLDPSVGTLLAVFYGRADRPRLTPHGLGVLVTVPLTDYLADLAAYTVGGVDWPREDAWSLGWVPHDPTPPTTRLVRAFREAGVPDPAPRFAPVLTAFETVEWPQVDARGKSPTNLLAVAQDTLVAVATRTTMARVRRYLMELRPNLVDGGVLDAVLPWVGVQLDREIAAPLVWQLSPTGTELLPNTDPMAHHRMIPAAATSWDATWERHPDGVVNTVDVVLADDTVVSASREGDPRVVNRVDTELVTVAAGADLATYLLPDPSQAAVPGWAADRFTVLMDYTPRGWWPGQLRTAMAVTGIHPAYNPDGTDTWTGVVVSQETDIRDGSCEVTVMLDPAPMRLVEPLPPDIGPGPIRWSELPPALTWAQLAGTGITWTHLAQTTV